MLSAAAMSAARASRCAAASASPSSAVDACVPLMSASPSFGPSVAGVRPARASAAAPGRDVDRRATSPFADQDQREVRQRREVAAGADRAARRHHRVHAAVQQRDQQVERLEPDAGEPLGQHVGAQRHRRAHDGHRQRLADAGGMAAQQVDLQLRQRVVRDLHLGEVAEARC